MTFHKYHMKTVPQWLLTCLFLNGIWTKNEGCTFLILKWHKKLHFLHPWTSRLGFISYCHIRLAYKTNFFTILILGNALSKIHANFAKSIYDESYCSFKSYFRPPYYYSLIFAGFKNFCRLKHLNGSKKEWLNNQT